MATSTKTTAKATTDAVETKAAETKTAAKKTTKTKTAETKTTAAKTTTKRTTKKAATVNPTYILQFSGKELNTNDIYENVKNSWVEQTQGKAEDIKTVEIYLKPEESRAYYVVNGESNENYFVTL